MVGDGLAGLVEGGEHTVTVPWGCISTCRMT
jgi:hypothetical protein